jgi:hypothetical protein
LLNLARSRRSSSSVAVPFAIKGQLLLPSIPTHFSCPDRTASLRDASYLEIEV